MLAHVVRVLLAGRSFDCASDQGVALRGIVKVCSRLRHQRIVREKLQAGFDSIFKVTRVAHFGVALGFGVGSFRHVIVADSGEMS